MTNGDGATSVRGGKREALLKAAIDVFGREGYSRASVEEISRLAEVAKPTLYNQFGDKATLFTEAVARAAAQSESRIASVLEQMSTHPDDLRRELEQLGTALVGCAMHADGAAVIRLQMTERATFGATLDGLRQESRERTLDGLAGKLAQLATAGLLDLSDARLAARHFLALISDEALIRSGYGTTVLERRDIEEPVAQAVGTFLAAFGTGNDDGSRAQHAPAG